MTKLHLSSLNRSRLGVLLIVIGIETGVASIGLSLHAQRAQPKPPPGSLTSKSAPSSVKPAASTVASYSVPPTDPKYVAIPTIGLGNTPVLRLGLLQSGAIATPDNIYETGWYDGSARPGQAGAMFIYGHVSSWTAKGAFYNLNKLKSGNTITITRGDNLTYTYRVISSKIYPYNNVDMNAVLSAVNPNTPGLNLMTCTGSIIKGTSEFSERLVVFTSLQKAGQ